MGDCACCVEKFNKSNRKKVECPKCNYACCRECINSYVTNDTVKDAHCMNCKVRFTDKFLETAFTKVWNKKTYREHRAKILFSEQESYLPDTQPYVQARIVAKELEKKNIQIGLTLNKLQLQMNELNEEYRKNYNDILRLTSPVYVPKKENDRREFVMPCIQDECKGYLNNKYKCGICETVVCSKCHKVKGDDHECDENDIKTVKEVNASTKPCPNCGIRTSKISGCPQMWCVGCHEVWCWNTGRKDTSGVIHNPHYFNYMREQNNGIIQRQPGDVPCGGVINLDSVFYARRDKRWGEYSNIDPKSPYNIIEKLVREKRHIEYYELRKFREIELSKYRELRIKFMLKDISRDVWYRDFKKLVYIDKIYKEYRELFGMYCASLDDLVRNSLQSNKPCIEEMKQLVAYTNDQINELNKGFKRKVVLITPP